MNFPVPFQNIFSYVRCLVLHDCVEEISVFFDDQLICSSLYLDTQLFRVYLCQFGYAGYLFCQNL